MTYPEDSRLLGHLLTLVAIGLLSAAVLTELLAGQHPFEHGPGSIVWGVFWLYSGLLFLAAFFHRNRCYLFRFLMWVCEHFSSPSHPAMAFFYAALGVGLGTAAILTGLGVIS